MGRKEFTEKVVEASVSSFGRIDVLVNAAGILKGGSLLSMKEEDYELSMNINLKAIINLTRLCLPHLITQKGLKLYRVNILRL